MSKFFLHSLPIEMKVRIAGQMLDCNERDECEESYALCRHLVRMWSDPDHEHPELIGFYFPGKVVKGKSPTMSDAARRGNMPMMTKIANKSDRTPNFFPHIAQEIKTYKVPSHVLPHAVMFGHIPYMQWLTTTTETMIGCALNSLFALGQENNRFNKRLVKWLLHLGDDGIQSSIIRAALESNDMVLVDYLTVRGYVFDGDIVTDVDLSGRFYRFDGRINLVNVIGNGWTDVLDWVAAHSEYSPQLMVDYLMRDKWDEGPLALFSEAAFVWFRDNGVVFTDWHFDNVMRPIVVDEYYTNETFGPSEPVTFSKQLKKMGTTRMDHGYAVKWLYENGCPINQIKYTTKYPEAWAWDTLTRLCERQ